MTGSYVSEECQQVECDPASIPDLGRGLAGAGDSVLVVVVVIGCKVRVSGGKSAAADQSPWGEGSSEAILPLPHTMKHQVAALESQ